MSTGRRQWLAALTVAAGIHAAAAFVMLSDGSQGSGGNGAGGLGGGIRVSLLPGTSGEPAPSVPAETGETEDTPEIATPPEPVPEPPPEEIVEDIAVEEPTIRPPEPSQLAQLPEAREPEPVPEPEPAPEPAPPPEPEPEPIPEPDPVEEEVVAAIPDPLPPPEPEVEPPPEPTPPQPAIEPPPRPQVKPTPPLQSVQAAALQPAPAAPAARTASATPAPTVPGPSGPADPSPTTATSSGGGGGGTPAGDGRRMDYATVLSAWLEQYKEYPRRAQSRRYEGIATLRFTVDRQGNVLSYRIDESSGHAALDRAVEEMIERAQPLPPMPEEITTAEMEVILPVAFRLE